MQRAELPSGYSWQEVPQIQAVFPLPKDWHYKYQQIQGTQAFFITKERILADSPLTSLQDARAGNGFRTGLSVNVFSDILSRTGNTPDALALAALTTNPLLHLEGNLDAYKEGSLAVHRGYFKSGSRLLAYRGMPPIRYYIEGTGNNNTNRAYLMMFETPEELWEQYKDIAKIIIENRILNQDY